MYTLSDFDHLRECPEIQFKEEIVDGKKFTIICYMISFSELWEIPLAKECRGITFDENGKLASFPFNKFFNLNENKFTQIDDLKSAEIVSVLNKLDGSMITPVLVNDKIRLKTKKSLNSDVAKAANGNMTEDIESLCKYLLTIGITPIFEYTDPDWQIVIDYGEVPNFTLIAARRHCDGAYLPHSELVRIGALYNVDVVETIQFESSDLHEISETVKNMPGIEGIVIHMDQDGEMTTVKIKTDEYRRLHHVKTDLRVRDIAEMIVDETIDDVKSVVSEAGGDLRVIEAIEEQIVDEMHQIWSEIYEAVDLIKQEPDRKTAALKYCKHNYFAAAIRFIENRTDSIDVKKYWKQRFLKAYPLKTAYSNFSQNES